MEFNELQQEVQEKNERLKEFRAQELDLRKKERSLTERLENAELDLARRVAAATKDIQLEATAQADERYALQLAEKDKQIQSVQTKLEEARQRAEQGSQERQGTVQQEALEQVLAIQFPDDEVTPVPRGRRGADVLQVVRAGPCRGSCGTILWESKRAQSWSDGWVGKLKDDQRRVGADVAVIVSSTLPKGAARIDSRSGVWITDLASASQLALVLREGVIAIARLQASVAGKNDLMGVLYDYITGPSFIEHVKAVLESLTGMQRQLSDERAAVERIWSKREQQIHVTASHMARMIGDLEGLGASLSVPPGLRLDAEVCPTSSPALESA
jgi:hypothetical protein